MAARLNTKFSVSRLIALPVRSRQGALNPAWRTEGGKLQAVTTTRQVRTYADSSKDLPVSETGKGPNTEQLPHVSEEAAATSRIMGESGPDVTQGTPIEDVVKNDPSAQAKLPKVMQDDLKKGKASTKPNTRAYSTSAICRRSEGTQSTPNEASLSPEIIANGIQQMRAPAATQQQQQRPEQPSIVGHKFGLPTLPLPPNANLHYRYETIVDQMIGLVMLDGKKAEAQRIVDYVLSHLRSSPPPQLRADRPLLPGHPPPSHLPLNAVLYLQLAIDSVAPMMRIRAQKGAAGGGVALQIPVGLHLRQRRRTAIMWIIDAAKKRKNRGSGKNMFAQRLAEEIVAVVEGKSGAWEKRNGIHKLGVAARSNLLWKPRKR